MTGPHLIIHDRPLTRIRWGALTFLNFSRFAACLRLGRHHRGSDPSRVEPVRQQKTG
jgi:hypothetical protein